MTKQSFYIKNTDFIELLRNLSSDYKVFLPYEASENYYWQQFNGEFSFTKYRTVASIRQFFTPATENVDKHLHDYPKENKPFCIVGAKSCDLSNALKMQDYVFLEGEIDENYKTMRDNNIIISSDCAAFKETCFCLSLKINPYPQELFDLNISNLGQGYIVEVGSEKGKNIINANKELFIDTSEKHIEERNKNRSEMAKDYACHIDTLGFPPENLLYKLIKGGYDNKIWPEEALRCVECGSCIMNCPTCHCFLLFDSKDEKGYFKGRIWDGCQYKNFTRVAGGASALRLREHRLRNRYIKKFEFFPDRIKTYACTGCGRCIEGCPAKIDIRNIFKTLSKE